MIVVMNPGVSEGEIKEVEEKLYELGFGVHRSNGENRTILGAVGSLKEDACQMLKVFPTVEKVVIISHPFKLVSREYKKENTIISVGDLEIGGDRIVVMGGPCAVEGKDAFIDAARVVKEGGAHILRGGAYKPRSSPYSFQGLEEEGLRIMAEASKITGLPFVTEVLDQHAVETVCRYADILQVGTRNMQNFKLLKELGRTKKPVLLKRGMSSTIEEWLMAAEYIVSEGNRQVILCERGIRTFETITRNTLDLSAVPIIKKLSHLPIFVDPSHGTGSWEWVESMSMAAVAAGADGLMVEVHPSPREALSDGPQSLNPEHFEQMMTALKGVASSVGRTL